MIVFIILFFLLSFPSYATTLDAGAYTEQIVTHTHVYQTQFNNTHHWEECTVCNAIKNKTTHALQGNGGSKTLFSNYTNTAYREVCSCGYQGPIQVVITGSYWNYGPTSTPHSYLNIPNLNNVRQITRAEFNSISYEKIDGLSYTWHDYDGDGYGHVFATGFAVGDKSRGITGTIEHFLGSEGEYGRKLVHHEYWSLIRYIQDDPTPTRAEYVAALRNKIGTKADHALKGYDIKYSNITDAQFNQLIPYFKLYDAIVAGYASNSMALRSRYVNDNNGNFVYYGESCYDGTRPLSYGDGKPGTCDVCGLVVSGNESYEKTYYYAYNYNSSAYEDLRTTPGLKKTIGPFSIIGLGNVEIAQFQIIAENRSGKIWYTHTITPTSGYTVSNSNFAWREVPTEDKSGGFLWNYPNTCNITKNGQHIRTIALGSYFVSTDNTRPTKYGYTNATTNTSYWKVIGNGTAGNLSTTASISFAFQDPEQMSTNILRAALYDSDGRTLIRQESGETWVPLKKNGSIYTGVLSLVTEVNGAKTVYVQAVDSNNHFSEKVPVSISYVDAKAPVITVTHSNNLNTWSQTKTFTVKATDGSGVIYIGVSNDELTRTNTKEYVFNGNLSTQKTVAFYAKDSVGNVSVVRLNINKLDNTPPTITTKTISDVIRNNEAVGWELTPGATDTLSGLKGYSLQRTGVYNPGEIEIPRSGVYTLFASDNVGNISSTEVVVHSDVYYNGVEVNEIERNGQLLDHIYHKGVRLRL